MKLIETYKGYKIYDNSMNYRGFDIRLHQRDDRYMVDLHSVDAAKKIVDDIT